MAGSLSNTYTGVHWALLIQSKFLSRLGPPANWRGSFPHSALSHLGVGCCRGLGWAWALRSQSRWSQMELKMCGVCQGRPKAQVVVWGKQYIAET